MFCLYTIWHKYFNYIRNIGTQEMKKFILLLALSFYIVNSFSQENQIGLLTYNGNIVYMDNYTRSWVTLYFEGDTVQVVNYDPRFFIIDKESLVQFMKYPIPEDLYDNSMEESAEFKLLQHFLDYEKKYFEKELFKTDLAIKQQFLKNIFGKNFLLWHFKVPENNKGIEYEVKYQLYLSFTMNDQVGLINLTSESENEYEAKLEYLKKLTNRVVVYGSWISIEGIYDKIDSWNSNKPIIISDSKKGLSLNIPSWLNQCETFSDNYWLFNFPDSANIKNALALIFIEKDEYKDLQEFNIQFLSTDNILEVIPDEYKITQLDMSSMIIAKNGSAIYHCHYNSFETRDYFVWLSFTATPSTYKFNIDKYLNIIYQIKVID
jgi:hypothetical protein